MTAQFGSVDPKFTDRHRRVGKRNGSRNQSSDNRTEQRIQNLPVLAITGTYWEIGRRIVECEQDGEDRAEYGKRIVELLSNDLTKRFGRGFSSRNLWYMKDFF